MAMVVAARERKRIFMSTKQDAGGRGHLSRRQKYVPRRKVPSLDDSRGFVRRFRSTMKTIVIVVAGLALACGSYAQEKSTGKPKEELTQLMQRAREAKAAGRFDEARGLAAKAHELAKELKVPLHKGEHRGEKKPGAHPEKKPGTPVETKPGTPPEKHVKQPHPAKQPGPPEKKAPPRFQGPEGERLHHVVEAIEHLRAAGLHEPAKGIEEIARNLHREMEERAKREHAKELGKEPEHPMAARVHAEMDEMRQQIRKLAEQVEQLHKELKGRAP